MGTLKATWRGLAAACLTAMLHACGGGGGGAADGGAIKASSVQMVDADAASTPLPNYGPNAVTRWAEAAAATVTRPSVPTGATPQERRSFWPTDLGTVHVAMYDAAIAIARTHKPFFVEPQSPSQGASADAAVMAAAYGVLQGLFPSRSAFYQPTYDAMLAELPDNEARARGLALGQEVAAGVLALRGGEDGRFAALPPFVPGTGPGEYRGAIFANRFVINMKPFAIEHVAQFRADGPPALASETYAADFAEVRDLGRSDSQLRTAAQTEAVRFHSEAANFYLPRNLNRFAASQPTLAENARLAAMLYVSLSDSQLACFESKDHFMFWRPPSAIALADSDGNDATTADPTWTPLAAAPPFPGYPSESTCGTASYTEVLAHVFGTKKLSFTFDSQVTNTSRAYASLSDLEEETFMSRIWAGGDFRTALVHGRVLATQAAKWILRHHFQPRD